MRVIELVLGDFRDGFVTISSEGAETFGNAFSV